MNSHTLSLGNFRFSDICIEAEPTEEVMHIMIIMNSPYLSFYYV